MNFACKLLAGVPALIFVLIGLRWLVVPGVANALLGMFAGRGRTEHPVGDFASFFLTLGGCILIGLATGNPLSAAVDVSDR
jgi:hypothetical protein